MLHRVVGNQITRFKGKTRRRLGYNNLKNKLVIITKELRLITQINISLFITITGKKNII